MWMEVNRNSVVVSIDFFVFTVGKDDLDDKKNIPHGSTPTFVNNLATLGIQFPSILFVGLASNLSLNSGKPGHRISTQTFWCEKTTGSFPMVFLMILQAFDPKNPIRKVYLGTSYRLALFP